MNSNDISAIPLFRDVPRSRRAEVARLADRLSLPAGRVMARQGARAHEFFVIVDGTAAVVRDGQCIAVLGPGDFFGEIALMSGLHRTATVVAASDVDVIVLAQREFATMLSQFPEIASAIVDAASRRVVATLRAVEAA